MLTDAQRSEISARMAVIAARHNARHRQMMAMLACLGRIDWDAYDALKVEEEGEWGELDALQRQLTRDYLARAPR